MVDLVSYLCEGKTLHDGHPSLHVTVPQGEGFEGFLTDDIKNMSTLEFECGTVVTPDVNSRQFHRALFEQLWERRLHLQQADRLMGGEIPTSFRSRQLPHGEGREEDVPAGSSREMGPRIFAIHDARVGHQGNKWAKWTHCTRCALRVSYSPSMGAPSSTMQTHSPEMVRRALNDLKDNLPKNVEPTEELVKLFIAKVTAEIRIEHIMEEAKRDLSKKSRCLQNQRARRRRIRRCSLQAVCRSGSNLTDLKLAGHPSGSTAGGVQPHGSLDGGGEEAHHGSGRKSCPSGARLGGRNGAGLWEQLKDKDLMLSSLSTSARR